MAITLFFGEVFVGTLRLPEGSKCELKGTWPVNSKGRTLRLG
jgi:hypothetical protein